MEIGGLSWVEAGGMAPIELSEAIEDARYRRLVIQDEIMRAAWKICQVFIGRKAGSFRKFVGRITADDFKKRVLGRSEDEKKRDRELIKQLKAKVEKMDKKGATHE